MGTESHYHSKKDRIFVRGIQGQYSLKDELDAAARDAARAQGEATSSSSTARRPTAATTSSRRTASRRCSTCTSRSTRPGGKSQKHGHVNEAAFYILDGEGYEIHDGVRYDWKAGDVAIVHNNCVHQHFNASPDKPARALVIKTKPMFMFMNMLFQKLVEPRPTEPAPGAEGFRPARRRRLQPSDERRTEPWPGTNRKRGCKGTAEPEAVPGAARRRDRRRRRATRSARRSCTRRTCPGRCRAQGLLKHLINEGMNTRMETVDAYMQIIPPGSRSGKHRHLAEECLYVLEGRGYDLHQDCDVEITDTYHWKPQDEVKRYEWEAGDVIYIPPNTIHQHFNADPDRPVRLISVHQPHLQGVRPERPRADRGRARVRSQQSC